MMPSPSLAEALELQPGDRVALVGAGGKTSLLYALARENYFGRALFSCTTKMYDPTEENHPFHRIILNPAGNCPLPENSNDCCYIAAGRLPDAPEKIYGLSNKQIDNWNYGKDWPILVIEADGSARKPIKAPGRNEPVIPGSVNRVIGCIGLDALGKPVHPDWIHRCDLFRGRFCKSDEEKIEPDTLVELIRHPGGLFQNCPAGAGRTVILNKLDCLSDDYKISPLLEGLKRNFPAVKFLALSLKSRSPQRSIIL